MTGGLRCPAVVQLSQRWTRLGSIMDPLQFDGTSKTSMAAAAWLYSRAMA
jgi:hypothetical protein